MSGHGKQMIIYCIVFILVKASFNKIRCIRCINNPGIAQAPMIEISSYLCSLDMSNIICYVAFVFPMHS